MNNRISELAIRLAPIIITILIYWFGVVRANEKARVEILQNKAQIEVLYEKIEKLEDKKADQYTIEIIMNTLDRIDSKIDKLQEQVVKK